MVLSEFAPTVQAGTLQDLSWRETILREWRWYWLLYIILGWEVRRMIVILFHRCPV